MQYRHLSLRVLVAALVAAALLAPAVVLAAPPGPPEDSLDEVRARLEDARDGLERVGGQKASAVEDVARIDARRAILERRLAALRTELAAAQAAVAEREAAVQATTAQLITTERKLVRTREELAAERRVFHERVRASYMHGTADIPLVVLRARDIAEFSRSVKFVGAVLATDRERVESVAGLARQISVAQADLEALQREQSAAQHAAALERDRVAALVAQQQGLTQEAHAEAQRHSVLLAELESDESSYVALVDSLEAESAQLEAELRRRAEEEARRRAEEEARRRAEEEAAQAQRQAATRPSPLPGALPRPLPGAGERAGPTVALRWPADGPKTSDFGWRTHPIFGTRRFHAGIDIGGNTGDPIYAAADGVVIAASSRGGYGNTTLLDHGDGMVTLYAHQSRFAVNVGQQVSRGAVIGFIGSTGYSTGPHLHFEVRLDGTPVDPMRYF